MAKVLVRANVAYPGDLLSALESFDRKPFGEVSFVAELDDDIHNLVYLIFTWQSLAKARAFWQSPAGVQHVESWHSVTKPELVYLRTLPHELAS